MISTSTLSCPYDQYETRSYPHHCYHIHMIAMKEDHVHIYVIMFKSDPNLKQYHIHIIAIMFTWSAWSKVMSKYDKYDQYEARSCPYLCYYVCVWWVSNKIISASILSCPYDQYEARSYLYLCYHGQVWSIWSKIMCTCRLSCRYDHREARKI